MGTGYFFNFKKVPVPLFPIPTSFPVIPAKAGIHLFLLPLEGGGLRWG